MDCCVIFCAGELDTPVMPLGTGDLIIAADGGYRHVCALGIRPHRILGDFDSLGYVPESAICYPVEKDDTDAMLAARLGLEQGYDKFIFYGALAGPRLDHTVANFQTLQFLADRGARGYLPGKHQLVTVIKNGTLTFPATAKGDLSVFCMGAAARGVTLEGLQYTMADGTLEPGFPLGVSNHFTGQPARVTVTEGSLLVIYSRENGLYWE